MYLSNYANANEAPRQSEGWRYAITFPMIWAPKVDGVVHVGDNEPIKLGKSFSDIFDKLSFGLMGEFIAVKDDIGVKLGFNYLKVDDVKTTSGFDFGE